MNGLDRKLTALAGVAGVLGLLLLPVEHVHFTPHHDHDHPDIVHRHVEEHHPVATEATIDHAEGEGEVEWLTIAFTNPEPPAAWLAGPDNQLLNDGVPPSPPRPMFQETIHSVPASAHDPPWKSASGLRAPPFLSI